MRQDQFDKLQALEEKLIDVYLEEINTDKWPGAGIDLVSMAKDTRGDRYWSKRNAAATAVLISRTQTLIGGAHGSLLGDAKPAAEDDDEAALDREIAAAERDAERLRVKVIEKAKAGSGKAAR